MNDDVAMFRVRLPNGTVRTAVGTVGEGPTGLLDRQLSVDALLGRGGPGMTDLPALPTEPVPDRVDIVVPVDGQPVWASGVTYLRSREAREAESDTPDHYERVYGAERPELFVKALPGTVVGPGDTVGVRADSGWDVPEPELGVVVDADGRLAAVTIGNDVSSRSIEGENPLYLPQAKTYHRSCALGPALVPVDDAWSHEQLTIRLRIERGGEILFEDEISAGQMVRTPRELTAWLTRCQDHPVGAVLLTGTGIVPPPSFTLTEGDGVDISITGLGTLANTVETVT